MKRQDQAEWMYTSLWSLTTYSRRRRQVEYNTSRSDTARRAKYRQVVEAIMVRRIITAMVSRFVTVPRAI